MSCSYTLSPDGLSIQCNLCGAVSHNANDVRERFCSRCKVFHEGQESKLDTSNMFGVGVSGERVVLSFAPGRPSMTKTEAAVLAAWLVAISGSEAEFKRAFLEIINT